MGRKLRWLLPVLTGLAVAGCQTAGYLRQAVSGQLEILRLERPVRKLMADAGTPPGLKEKFREVERLRQFAKAELALPIDGHYLRYADLHRRYVVWNVYAAPEFSLRPKAWWYPIVGRLVYHGYFSEAEARRYADRLRQRGWDVYVEGVEAYSTLGWFKDPLLNTFIHERPTVLAETLFHELAHQRLFVGSDTDFDEAFATAVGEEGVRRWLAASGDPLAAGAYEQELARDDELMQLVMDCRRKLSALYRRAGLTRRRPGAADGATQAAATRREKERIIAELRVGYARLRARRGGDPAADRWFAGPLNNAQLNAAATYYVWVPAFHRLLEQHGGDLKKFYRAAAELARLPEAQRHRRLEALLTSSAPSARPRDGADARRLPR
ncbi:MAG: aminopeptidase [Verrucomicrobia bacterium]|nr:aminopeptidase [Verrucomicrobiota bacterium]